MVVASSKLTYSYKMTEFSLCNVIVVKLNPDSQYGNFLVTCLFWIL